MDRLAAIEAFVRVAESGSFSQAAERLRSSKSVVSRQISALEAELGARLLHRTTRALTLTEAGRSYFERATRILADLAEANASVGQLQAAPRGRLRVNAPMSFGFLHLAPAVPDFLNRYPDVALELTMNDRFVDLGEAERRAEYPEATRVAFPPAARDGRPRHFRRRRLRCGDAQGSHLDRAADRPGEQKQQDGRAAAYHWRSPSAT